MSLNIPNLMEFLRSQIGRNLRAVAHAENSDVKLEYLREDMQEKFDQDDIDKLANAYTEGEYSRDYLEDVHKIDELEYLVLKDADSVTVVMFPGEDKTVYVAFDSSIDIMPSTFVNECLSQLGVGGG